LGSLYPQDQVAGVQDRLNNVGDYCDSSDGIVGQLTSRALRNF